MLTRPQSRLARIIGYFFEVVFGNRTEILESQPDSPLINLLQAERPELFSDYEERVVPATAAAEQSKQRLNDAHQAKQEAMAAYALALAVIRTKNPRLVGELKGGLSALWSRLTRFNLFLLLDSFRHRYITQGQRYQLLVLVSAGLGILNFLSFLQILGLDLNRPTPSMLFLVPLGVAFSAAASVAVKVGLSSYIRATRSYRVPRGSENHRSLFPHGKKDSAVFLSILIVTVDALFSTIGLLSALPPGVRGEFLWQMATLAVAAFASIVNVILAWGLTLEDIHYGLRHKEESVEELEKRLELQDMIIQAKTAQSELEFLKREIPRLTRQSRKAVRQAVREYLLWRLNVDEHCRMRMLILGNSQQQGRQEKLRSQNGRNLPDGERRL